MLMTLRKRGARNLVSQRAENMSERRFSKGSYPGLGQEAGSPTHILSPTLFLQPSASVAFCA